MHYIHDIDPIFLALGPVQIHWYGLMYLIGFSLAYWLGMVKAKRPDSGWTKDQVSDLIFYGAVGLVLGARFGYVLFYNFGSFLDDPLMLIKVWQGGMSFHGGVLGVITALILFSRKYKKNFFDVTDFLVPLAPLGIFAGRMGNFINGELWGKVSDLPWAIVFPHGGALPRHPSMLYEGILEGLVLFAILWWYTTSAKRPRMAASGLFLIGYGIARFTVEFVRLPDAHIGYLAWGWLTMGQVLTTPMILAGAIIMAIAYQRQKPTK